MTISVSAMILDTVLVCETHLKCIKYAKSKLSHLFPLEEQKYKNLTNDDIAYIDHFIERFSKLQDAMGAKLFSQIIDLSQEQGQLSAFIDKLNRLEKIGVIPNAHKWIELRALKNSFAHDYPADITMNIQTLNTAFKEGLYLQTYLESCQKFINQHIPN